MNTGWHKVWIGGLLVAGLAAGFFLRDAVVWVRARTRRTAPAAETPPPPRVPTGRTAFSWRLTDANSERMSGLDDSANERWLDCANNIYSTDFIRNFSYTGTRPRKPIVRVAYDRTGPVFRGRLEAAGLKPNFAYQIKLRGDYQRDSRGFETIGYTGRWRLPGRDTNYTDFQYQLSARSNAEAYILFDFFVTDERGCAIRDFELASTLHVLFNATYQGPGSWLDSSLTRVHIDASDPRFYAVPKKEPCFQYVWAESEKSPGRGRIGRVRLPAGDYRADLILTEESFHANGDGGFWATVMRMPVDFTITAGPAAPSPAGGPRSP